MLTHFAGQRTGHASNNRLLRKLFSDPANWEYSHEVPQPSTEPMEHMEIWDRPSKMSGVIAGKIPGKIAATA